MVAFPVNSRATLKVPDVIDDVVAVVGAFPVNSRATLKVVDAGGGGSEFAGASPVNSRATLKDRADQLLARAEVHAFPVNSRATLKVDQVRAFRHFQEAHSRCIAGLR